MDTERKWLLKLSGGILLADMSQVLEFLQVILFIAFHIRVKSNKKFVSLKFLNDLKVMVVCLDFVLEVLLTCDKRWHCGH